MLVLRERAARPQRPPVIILVVHHVQLFSPVLVLYCIRLVQVCIHRLCLHMTYALRKCDRIDSASIKAEAGPLEPGSANSIPLKALLVA